MSRLPGEEGGDPRGPAPVGTAAIKWSAIVVIVLSVLYFLARYVIPLFSR